MSVLNKESIKPILIGAAAGLLITFLTIVIMAFGLTIVDIEKSAASPISSVAAAIGAFFGGFISSKLLKKRGLITGIVTGLIIYLFLTVIALILNSGDVTMFIFIRLAIILLSAAIGGILGVNTGSSKKYIK